MSNFARKLLSIAGARSARAEDRALRAAMLLAIALVACGNFRQDNCSWADEPTAWSDRDVLDPGQLTPFLDDPSDGASWVRNGPIPLAPKASNAAQLPGRTGDSGLLPLRPPPGSGQQSLAPDLMAAPEQQCEYDAPLLSAPLLSTPRQVPVGFSGPSGIATWDEQTDDDFVPEPDRWRGGYPLWDRYGPDHYLTWPYAPLDDSPYARGWELNPYRQNVLKGDYPIIGQHTFLNVTAISSSDFEYRQVPTVASPFESPPDPGVQDFFGNPDQFALRQDFSLSFDLSHGDAGFKPSDWRVRLTPIFNLNYLDVNELGVVGPDVRDGEDRFRTYMSLEEWFGEVKLADTSPDYDFVSLRVGSQPFVSDFRGFIFSDINRGARVFGTNNSNRDQYNAVVFDQLEKDTNSGLNTFRDRDQTIAIANYFRQDFIWPGYTSQLSVHYNQDNGNGLVFDRNGFLVRPDPAGVFEPHQISVGYLGWTGDGHINRFNIDHAFYWALGHDDLNPLAGRDVSINAQMAAAEVSYDRDWMRFRTSVLWASGDHNISNGEACGFDTIMDDPNFAGGEFSYWQRQAIKLLGVNLVNQFSLVPDLRSSKTEGQVNFVNPGLFLYNVGADAELTPQLRLVSNANFLWFESTNVLEQFLFQAPIHRDIGTDLSIGFENRPLLNDNLILTTGVSALVPGQGFRDIYDPMVGSVGTLFATFLEVVATF
jgi:hypothetical protein